MIVAALLFAGTAGAVELEGDGLLAGASVQTTNELHIRYYRMDRPEPGFEEQFPNLHDYVEQVDRINLLISKDGLTIGATVDEVALFSNRYLLDGEMMHSWPLYQEGVLSPFDDALVRLEKLYVQRRFSAVELAAGDVYASFGRGIALNIVKNTDVDVDTSLRGAKAVVRAGQSDLSFVTGLSNPQWISVTNPNLSIDQDPRHMVSGARWERFGLGPVNAGAHAVVYRFARQEDEAKPSLLRYEEPLDAQVAGLTLEAPGVGGLDLYAEADYFRYPGAELQDPETGADDAYAAYASVAAYPGRLALLLEGRASKDSERINTFTTPEGWEVATIPTLEYERVITEDGAAAVNSNDLRGARLRADLRTKWEGVVPYASVAAFRDEDLGGVHFNESPETIGHAMVGVSRLGHELIVRVNAGYRQDVRDEAAEGADELLHFDGDVHFPLSEHLALELASDAKRFAWGNNLSQQTDFGELSNSVSVYYKEKLIGILYQDWSDNELIQSEGNLSENVYGAAEIRYKPNSSSTLALFYGAYKAGIRCSGGQCRQLPGFDGGRLSFQTTF